MKNKPKCFYCGKNKNLKPITISGDKEFVHLDCIDKLKKIGFRIVGIKIENEKKY